MSDSLTDMKAILARVATGVTLDVDESEHAFDIIMSGDATPAQIGAFLMALRQRGETVDEITGAVRSMRSKALHIEAPDGAMDIVGTGGDASGTLNISTGAALVVAGAGVTIAKHGNKALSSKAGAADVLTALGVNIEADMSLVKRAIWEIGFGFMMAPRHHGAMRHVAGPRVELGTRTVFNLLGPLSNPAGVTRQFSGAFAREWIEPMAKVLGNLGCTRAWVVHGADGLDELTTTDISYVAELAEGEVRCFEVSPEDAGIARAQPADLLGDTAEVNAKAMRAMLDGEPGPFRDAVIYNSAGAFIVAGKAEDLGQGVELARDSVDYGKAHDILERLVALTNESVSDEATDRSDGEAQG